MKQALSPVTQMYSNVLKTLFVLVLVALSLVTRAQGECLVSFVSHHVVENQTSDTLRVLVDHRNQKSFPTDGPTEVMIPPNSEIEVSQLEWAQEFRDPTGWFVFAWKGVLEGPDLNTRERWVFTQDDDTTGTYRYIIQRR